MILDAQLMFSDAQAVTADAISTNVIDLGVGRNVFDGEPFAVLLAIDVAADFTTTDETYSVQIRTDDNSSFSSPTTLLTHAILASALTAGRKHIVPVPFGSNIERFIALYYDVGGTTPTITVTAFLQPLSMIEKNRDYADAITIS